jgi:hypothetical protein
MRIECRSSAAVARLNSSGRTPIGDRGRLAAIAGALGIGATGTGDGGASGAAATARFIDLETQAETAAPLAMTSADFRSARRDCADPSMSFTMFYAR